MTKLYIGEKVCHSIALMFIDERTVKLKAGNGGDGCMSFRREKYIPKGGPNGGDGGRGGDIILVGDENVSDLTTYKFKPNWKAQNAETGRGNDQHGKNGAHLELKMPLGTVVYDPETGRQVTEITEHGQKVTLLKGGAGGLGNVHFKSSTNRSPRQFTEGERTEEREFRLVLKVMADVGFVGYPNAGKSSLISLVTAATPKAAPYPFTTKSPQIGIIEYPDDYQRLTLADVPGLIKGASQNRGLGHRFLRHLERCKYFLVIIDMSGWDDRDPLEDYASLLEELRLYKKELGEKPHFVAANKMDLEESVENLERFRKKFDVQVRPISCETREGIDSLRVDLLEMYHTNQS